MTRAFGILITASAAVVIVITTLYRSSSSPSVAPSISESPGRSAQLEPAAATEQPSILELLKDRRWLVIFQNPYELRPTGGFWGTIALLNLTEDGQPILSVDDVYAIDGPSEKEKSKRPIPPSAILQYLGVDRWYLRDANWDPDFPTSAQQGIEMYHSEAPHRVRVDGLIAVTPELLEDVLRATGPVILKELTIRAENAVDTIEEFVEQGYRRHNVPPFARKTILGDAARVLMERLGRLPSATLTMMLKNMPRYQQRRAIQIYALNPALQRIIVASGWSGAMSAPLGDSVLVIDSNMAALKTDAVIERATSYTIANTPAGWEAILELRYTHTKQQFDWKTTRYRTYTRVYVPVGSQLLSTTGTLINDRLKNPSAAAGTVDVSQQHNRTIFGFFTALEPGQERIVTLRWRLPPLLVDSLRQSGQYHLLVSRQAGVPARPLTVKARFDTTMEPVVIHRTGETDEEITIPINP